MRLELILPQVNPTEFKTPLVCPHKHCQCRHFECHQEVEKPLKDTRALCGSNRLGRSKAYDAHCLAQADQEGIDLWMADRRWASVSSLLERDSDSSWTFTGTTGSEGTVTFSLPNAPSGCYTTSVTDVTEEGLTWDPIDPGNVSGDFCTYLHRSERGDWCKKACLRWVKWAGTSRPTSPTVCQWPVRLAALTALHRAIGVLYPVADDR